MSSFKPTTHNLREALLFCFHLKKSAAESFDLLSEAYGNNIISSSTCDNWFKRFKDGDFNLEDKKRPGGPKKFEDEELETLLSENPSQTVQELADTLSVKKKTVSRRLKSMEMIRKQGNWVYELKPTDIERRFLMCQLLLQWQGWESFLHCIVTGGEKWIYYNPERKESCKPGQPSTLTAKNIHRSKVMLCIWWDQKGVVYYELLKLGETITGDRYQQQLVQLNEEFKIKRPEYVKRNDKVIFLHDNTRPHVAESVKETLEQLEWTVLPHPPYSPDIAPSDFHLFRSMQNDLSNKHFSSSEDIKIWLDSWIKSQDEWFFHQGIDLLPERWEKIIANDGQYFE